MMSKKLKAVPLLFVPGMLLGSGHNSKVGDSERQELHTLLKTSFISIYFARGGLDYPHTKEGLDSCVQYNDKSCLGVFNDVIEAKNTIESVSGPKALDATLDIIEETCLADFHSGFYDDNADISATCYGGIMSLYLYNSPEQDAKILSRVKNYPKIVRNMIFNTRFYWYHNRPNYKPWVDYIAIADVDWEPQAKKQNISDMFKSGMEDI